MRIGVQHRFVDALDRRQRKAGAAGAEDDRRHHDVQPVEAAGGEETRHGVGAAFDQDAAQAALGERRQDRGRRDLAVGLRQGDDLDVGRQRRAGAGRGHDQAADAVRGEQPGAGRQPAARVDDHPRRLRAGHPADRELRVVGERRADPDHHRIDQRAQPVQVGKAGRAVDVVGMAGGGGDPAVQRLADLADHHQVVDLPARSGPNSSSQGVGRGAARPETLRERAVQESISGLRSGEPSGACPTVQRLDLQAARAQGARLSELYLVIITCHGTRPGAIAPSVAGMGAPLRCSYETIWASVREWNVNQCVIVGATLVPSSLEPGSRSASAEAWPNFAPAGRW